MRIKVTSSKEVYDGTPESIWHQIHESSANVKHQSKRDYFDGVIVRLIDIKIYLDPPAAVRNDDKTYAEWMLDEFVRLGRVSETDEPTTIEQKAAAELKKAEAAKAKAEAAKAKAEAAKAKAESDAPSTAAEAKPDTPKS